MPGNSVFLSSETSMSENFSCCIKGVNTISNFKRESGISLQTLQREEASSHDDGGTSWFSQVAAGRGDSLAEVSRLLDALASLVVEQGL